MAAVTCGSVMSVTVHAVRWWERGGGGVFEVVDDGNAKMRVPDWAKTARIETRR